MKAIQQEVKETREQFLKEQAADHRLAGKISEAKIVDMIRKTEYDTRCFAHLRRIRGKTKNGSLQFITVPDPTDPEMDLNKKRWVAVFDQEEQNDLLKNQNKKHFSQAEGMPFTVEPLRSLFWCHANTFAAKQL